MVAELTQTDAYGQERSADKAVTREVVATVSLLYPQTQGISSDW